MNAWQAAIAFPGEPGAEVLPWLDQPPRPPDQDIVRNQLVWEEFDAYLTPVDRFFGVAHYGWPTIDADKWALEIGGRVGQKLRLTLDDIKARPRQDVVFTIECAGNHGFDWFTGGIGTARWTGTPLAAILEEAGIEDDAVEIVFFGADSGEATFRDVTFREHFARSMRREEALSPRNLLAYEMNGEPLPARNGFPLRLIAPGWYGIANVKWLDRIEAWPRRYMGHFMTDEYVTLREEDRDGEALWTRSSVGPARIKSLPAKVIREGDAYRIVGAAWGAPIERVEVRIDEGDWQRAVVDEARNGEFAWSVWSLPWTDPAPGEHTITSRAVDATGRVQPAPGDPQIAAKRTYWENNGQVTRRIRVGD